jgi:hypothetical protein
MTSFVFTGFKNRLLKGDVDFDTADVRALLVMTNTTADTQEDSNVLSDITTMDEYNGSGYARPALTGEVVNQDNSNNRAEFDANDFTFGATVGAGTRQAQAMILYRHVDGTAANDQLIAFIDTGGFPFTGNGGAVNVVVNAEGLLQAT